MFKNIMLPLDGTPLSKAALPLATRVAAASGAKLHLVRVHAEANEESLSLFQDEIKRDKERADLHWCLADVRADNVEADAELLEGPVPAGLQRYAHAAAIDLVIMSTRGRTSLQRALLGSVAESLLRSTHVPVLLLRYSGATEYSAARDDGLEHVLITLDGSRESEQVLEPAVELAQLAGARVTLLRVVTAPFDIWATLGAEALQEYIDLAREQTVAYLERLRGRLARELRVDLLVASADRAADGILQCAETTGATLIAMATHGRTGWRRVAFGSVAENVLHDAELPVLIFRPASVPISDEEKHEETLAGSF